MHLMDCKHRQNFFELRGQENPLSQASKRFSVLKQNLDRMVPMDLVLSMMVPLNLTKVLSMNNFRAVALMNFSIFESKEILLEDSYLKT